MFRSRAAAIGIWVVMAVGGALAGCAGSDARLPECRGTAVPINARVETVPLSGAETGGGRAHSGPVAAGADDGE